MVYTDRALNHMSAPFKKVMLDIGDMLKEVYHAENAVIIPGSGTYAMEAVARHFATNKKVMVLRNGYFSYRWTHIFETCATPTPKSYPYSNRTSPSGEHTSSRRATPRGSWPGLRKGP